MNNLKSKGFYINVSEEMLDCAAEQDKETKLVNTPAGLELVDNDWLEDETLVMGKNLTEHLQTAIKQEMERETNRVNELEVSLREANKRTKTLRSMHAVLPKSTRPGIEVTVVNLGRIYEAQRKANRRIEEANSLDEQMKALKSGNRSTIRP